MKETPVGSPDLDAYERKPGEPETLGDEKGRFEGKVPLEAIRESDEARHPAVRTAEGKIVDAHATGAPHDPFSEERVSDEPRYADLPTKGSG